MYGDNKKRKQKLKQQQEEQKAEAEAAEAAEAAAQLAAAEEEKKKESAEADTAEAGAEAAAAAEAEEAEEAEEEEEDDDLVADIEEPTVADAWDESEEEAEEEEGNAWDDEEDDDEPDAEAKAIEEAKKKQALEAKKKAAAKKREEERAAARAGPTAAELAEEKLEKAREAIEKRRRENEAKRNTDRLRAPICAVLGHVDTGKTKLLDKIRRTNVQDGEAGGITQQIGATNIPAEEIIKQTRSVTVAKGFEMKLPGLLIIDTPGHESFSNLRSRGSSLCNIAILVVDIMHGIEPQTAESLDLLRKRKAPFVIALNKIDRLNGWIRSPNASFESTYKKQKQHTKQDFEDRYAQVKLQFAERGLNVDLWSNNVKNKTMTQFVNIVPTSAHTGEGIPDLLHLLCYLTQTVLAKQLSFSQVRTGRRGWRRGDLALRERGKRSQKAGGGRRGRAARCPLWSISSPFFLNTHTRPFRSWTALCWRSRRSRATV